MAFIYKHKTIKAVRWMKIVTVELKY